MVLNIRYVFSKFRTLIYRGYIWMIGGNNPYKLGNKLESVTKNIKFRTRISNEIVNA